MSMNNKQRWMGGVVLLGGGVLLTALLLKGKDEIHQSRTQQPNSELAEQQNPADASLKPLTLDVETEQRLLEEQRRHREKSVAEQEARAAEFLAMQQQAEADAARKAAEEYAALNAHRAGQQSSDNIPPELAEDEQEKQKRLAAEKVEAQKKADKLKAEQAQKSEEQKKVAEAKKQTEEQRKAEEAKKKAEIEKVKVAEEKAAEKKAAEEKRKAEEAKKKTEAGKAKAEAERKAAEKKAAEKKAEAEKARKLLDGESDKQWMVQVALAANEANADAVAAKLKAKGYKVTKSQTSKGIRIMVGPAKDREAADATRKKIASDASLDMKAAWVNEWTPLDKRN